MANPGSLKLNLFDARQRRLRQPVDIMLRHASTGTLQVVRATKTPVIVKELRGAPDGVYRVEVDPASYLAAGSFISLAASGVTALDLTFPVDPQKVKRLNAPAFDALPVDAQRILTDSHQVKSFEQLSGETLYDGFDDIRRAGFLNIVAKATATGLTNGRAVISYVQELQDVRGDRFFARVSQELRDETKNSAIAGFFHEAPSGMHHPPAGFVSAGSWKSGDHYGNLQLTFFTNATDWLADIDIDDAGGLEHVFQVLRNELGHRATHPYDIHEILLLHQKVDPGYDLVV